MRITVYTLAWDNNDGVGCEVYTTAAERDAAFRAALLSWCDRQPNHIRALPTHELHEYLAAEDAMGGARYSPSAQRITLGD